MSVTHIILVFKKVVRSSSIVLWQCVLYCWDGIQVGVDGQAWPCVGRCMGECMCWYMDGGDVVMLGRGYKCYGFL